MPSNLNFPKMDLALKIAREALIYNEVPIGAALFYQDELIAISANRTVRENNILAHAEMIVLQEAMQKLGQDRLCNCELYVTLEPCTMCCGAISHARIKRLYYGAADIKAGAVENGVNFFNHKSCLHRPEIYANIHEIEASSLLKDFFRQLRSKRK